MSYIEKLAKIKSANLEIKDSGILKFWINVDYEDGFSQNIGGIALDKCSKNKESRVGTAFGCELIRLLLIEFGVNDFSEMKGKKIWAIGEEKGFSFKPFGVKALRVDNPNSKKIIFDEVLKEFKNAV